MATFDAGSIEADVDLDVVPFKRALQDAKREGERFAQNKFSPKLDADDTEFRRKINQAKLALASLSGTTRVNVDVSGGVDDQLTSIKAAQTALDGSNIKISVAVQGGAVAVRQLSLINQLATRLDGRVVTFRADADTSGAQSRIAALQAQLAGLNGGGGGGGGGGGSSSASGFLSPNRMYDLAAAGITAAAALAPVGVVALGVGAGLVSMTAAAGGAAAAFGGVFMGAIMNYKQVAKDIETANKNLDTQKKALEGLTPGTEAYAVQLQKVAEAQKAVDTANKAMTPSMKTFDRTLNSVKQSWADLIEQTSPATLGVGTTVLQGVNAMLEKTAPLVNKVAPIFQNVADRFKEWAAGPGGTKFIGFLSTTGVSALRQLVGAGQQVVKVVGRMIYAFGGFGGDIARNIKDMTVRLNSWSQNGGFERFLAKVKENAPAVKDFFKTVGTTLGHFTRAIADLGPVALLSTVGILKLINAIPQPVLTALVGGFVLWRAAILGLTVVAAITKLVRGFMLAWRVLNFVFAATPIGAIITAIVLLVAAFVVLWNKCEGFRNFWKGMWNVIQNAIGHTWNVIRDDIFGPIGRFFTRTIPGWLRRFSKANSDAWHQVLTTISDVWGKVRRNVLNPIGDFFTKKIPGWASTFKKRTVQAFNDMKDGVVKAFKEMKRLITAPVKIIVDTIYNKGIRGVWNTIAGAIGLGKKKLGAVDTSGWGAADGGTFGGGRVTGGGYGKTDSINARLAANEHVWTSEEVRAAGGHQSVARMRSAVLGGQRVRSIGAQGGHGNEYSKITGFADGGGMAGEAAKQAGVAAPSSGRGITDVVNDVGGWVAKLARGALGAVANPLLDGLKSTVKSLIPGGGFGDMARGLATTPIDWIKDWIKKDDESHAGGKGVQDAIAFANAQIGKPYQYGGGMDPSFDCSSFMSSIAKVILGQDPHGRVWSTMDFQGKNAPAGWEWHKESPFKIGVTNGPNGSGGREGHTAGTLGGVNYEATPPVLRKGPGARGYNDSMFTDWYGFVPATVASIGAPGAGQVNGSWSAVVMQALTALGESPNNLANVMKAMAKESGGNQFAINNWDSNAAAGIPSKGLMQVIDPTFATYAGPYRSRGIYDPLANIYAAINYARNTYGGSWSARMAQPGGYAGGTASALAGIHRVAENGPELVSREGLKTFVGGERVFNARETRALASSDSGCSGHGPMVAYFTDDFRGVIIEQMDNTMGEIGRSR